jgi:hypothetical protein
MKPNIIPIISLVLPLWLPLSGNGADQMTSEEYEKAVTDWITTARHPQGNVSYNRTCIHEQMFNPGQAKR